MFYFISGLKLNVGKSEIFSIGLSDEDLHMILQYTGYREGKLSLRYLGVPLVTRKLLVGDLHT